MCVFGRNACHKTQCASLISEQYGTDLLPRIQFLLAPIAEQFDLSLGTCVHNLRVSLAVIFFQL